MLIELESIFNTEGMVLPISYEFSLSEIDADIYQSIQEPVKVEGEVKNRAGIVTLNAKARLCYVAPCDRCSEEVRKEYEFPVEHTLVVALESGENDAFIEVPNLRLNLDELVEEDVNLALPTKYLCNEECKGLCHMCGKNLNEGPCDCKKPIDPRMETLLQLLDD